MALAISHPFFNLYKSLLAISKQFSPNLLRSPKGDWVFVSVALEDCSYQHNLAVYRPRALLRRKKHHESQLKYSTERHQGSSNSLQAGARRDVSSVDGEPHRCARAISVGRFQPELHVKWRRKNARAPIAKSFRSLQRMHSVPH